MTAALTTSAAQRPTPSRSVRLHAAERRKGGSEGALVGLQLECGHLYHASSTRGVLMPHALRAARSGRAPSQVLGRPLWRALLPPLPPPLERGLSRAFSKAGGLASRRGLGLGLGWRAGHGDDFAKALFGPALGDRERDSRLAMAPAGAPGNRGDPGEGARNFDL